MRQIDWRSEPKGPGRDAVHMFLDAGGERVELLAYDCPAFGDHPRMCGFEVFGKLRDRKGNIRPSSKFWEQLAAGEACSLEAAKAAALAMVERPRAKWEKQQRSWVKC